MASALLPRFIALKSGSNYVQFRPKEDVELSSRMVLSENSYTRFEVVGDSTPGSQFINIRTCYNNKFLTRDPTTTLQLLRASVDEPQPNRSQSSCTLFRPIYNSNTLRLFYQMPSGELPVWSPVGGLLRARAGSALDFEVIDLIKLVVLPKNVSFKGDNNQYLQSEYIRTRNRLEFGASDRLNPKVHHETYTLNNGEVRLRSITFNRFWRKSNPEWIWCDSNDTSANDRDTLFRPIRLDTRSKTIALVSVGNGKYCKRRVKGGQPRLIGTLIASASNLVPEAVMTVEEAIRDREIFDIRYNLDLARKYDVQPLWVEPKELFNPTDQTLTQTANFTYQKLNRETFSSSHSWKLSAEANVTVTVIPLLVQGEFSWNATYEGEVKWETTNIESFSTSHGVQVPVPPMTRSVVTLIVERGSIDVPFTYRQRDVLLNGRHVENVFQDGLFTGVNTYVSTYHVQHFRIDSTASRFDGEDKEEEDEDEDEAEEVKKRLARPSSRL